MGANHDGLGHDKGRLRRFWELKENLSYEEVLVDILDWQVQKLRNKEVAFEKVLWRNQLLMRGATWEDEADMMSRIPHLFLSSHILY